MYNVKSSCTNTQSLKLAFALQAHFLEWRLIHFGKELFSQMVHDRLSSSQISHEWCMIPSYADLRDPI